MYDVCILYSMLYIGECFYTKSWLGQNTRLLVLVSGYLHMCIQKIYLSVYIIWTQRKTSSLIKLKAYIFETHFTKISPSIRTLRCQLPQTDKHRLVELTTFHFTLGFKTLYVCIFVKNDYYKNQCIQNLHHMPPLGIKLSLYVFIHRQGKPIWQIKG